MRRQNTINFCAYFKWHRILELPDRPLFVERHGASRCRAKGRLLTENTETTVETPEVSDFASFGLRSEVVQALADQGITHPFPIQALTLPVALTRHDIIGQAKTGTGKTLGFGLPLLEHVVGPEDEGFDELAAPGKPQALVVLPTRELCKQVGEDLRAAAKQLSIRIVDIYGGVAFEPQVAALERGAEIVVGTPGRLIDLSNRKILDLSHVQNVVLDEADEMLDLGFLPDVEKLLSKVGTRSHTMLFSATMPGAVVAMARRYMTQPTHIRAQDPDDQGATVRSVEQFAYRCHAMNKSEVIARILQAEGRERTIIFMRTKRSAATLADDLAKRGFAVASLHGDLGQGARERSLRAFRNGKVDVLIATDVAARGIDVDDVTHVINYQSPDDDSTYLHRIGRTGRAGASGTAITLVDWDDIPKWNLISRGLGLELEDPVETYHTSPHLYEQLNISTDVTDRLPRSQRTRAGLDAEKIEDVEGKKSGRGGSERGGGRGRNRGQGGGRNRGQGQNRDAAGTGERAPRARRQRRRVNRSRQSGNEGN